MDAYVYQAALQCEDCASQKMHCLEYVNITMGRQWPRPGWHDSTCYPQDPYPSGGGEADSPQHCDACGVFLENPLTGHGTHYVNEKLIEYARDGSGNKDVLAKRAAH
jgi:hypothetical protein